MSEVLKKLLRIQQELKVPKTLKAEDGNYFYRSAEQILDLVRPMLEKEKCVITLSDSIEAKGTMQYIVASATIIDTESGERESSTACAREKAISGTLDDAQLTGIASSYARKYALCGLLAISTGDDADGKSSSTTSSPEKLSEDELRKFVITVGLNKDRTLGEVFDACKKANSANAIFWVANNDPLCEAYAKQLVYMHPELQQMI